MSVKKKLFSPKINQDRVANNVFDLQNDFHEDRLSFPVYGEKINLGHFRPFLRLAVLKVQNFCQNKSSRAEKLATSLFLYGESVKNWSRDDLPTPQIPAYEVYPDNDS
jgi:hypothetical protein